LPRSKLGCFCRSIWDTSPSTVVFNPGYAEAATQQIWGTAKADVIRDGMTPQAAAEKALEWIGTILAKYPIVQSTQKPH